MTLAQQLAASLRKMAAEFPATDEEQRTLKGAAGMLERIAEFAAELEGKGVEVRKLLRQAYGDTLRIMDRVGMAAKASTYDEEARRLRAITEGR